MKIDSPRIAPENGPARQLVVLLHGYGADGDDLIELGAQWRDLLPEAAFVAPHAPATIPGFPPGMGGGRQWFALDGYDPDRLRRDPQQAATLYRSMRGAADAVAPALDAFIDAELTRYGLAGDRLALVGFSQGTMMALHVGLRRRPRPAAILGYSGALLGAGTLPEQIHGRPPVLLIHGDADDIVPVEAMYAAIQTLATADCPARFHICPGLGHGIDADGLRRGGRFLTESFAPGL